MAKGPSPTSPDFNLLEDQFLQGFQEGSKTERQYRPKRVYKERESARRGGRRTGRAEGRKQGLTEGLSQGKAQGERAGRSSARKEIEDALGFKIGTDPEAAAALQRRKAFRAGQAAQRDAMASVQSTRTPRSTSGSGASLSAPDFSLPGFSGGGLDRATAARLVVVMTALSAGGVVLRDTMTSTPMKWVAQVNGQQIAVPQHLRSLAGVVMAGTVALIATEFDPRLGIVLSGVLLLDIVLSTGFGGKGNTLADVLGGGLMGKLVPASTPAGGNIQPGAPIWPGGPNKPIPNSKSGTAKVGSGGGGGGGGGSWGG